MLLLIVGIVLFVVGWNNYSGEKLNGALILEMVVVVISLLPIQGYQQPELVQKVELLPLEGESGNYLKQDKKYYHYAYDNRIEYGLEGAAYKEDECKQIQSKVYYSKECAKPILKVYKANTGIFSVGVWWVESEYVFYLPAN